MIWLSEDDKILMFIRFDRIHEYEGRTDEQYSIGRAFA